MRVLITGATGFVGQAATRALVGRGLIIRAAGRNPATLAALKIAGVESVALDLRDRAAVSAACVGVDSVLHLGALSSPWGRAAEFHAVNVGGTSHVIAGCREHRVRRLVYLSSPSVVFGGRDQEEVDETASYPRQFASTYSLTKKLGEDLVNDASRGGLETVILRPKAVFGPGDTTLLPRIVDAARAGRLRQIGDGQNRVDLTYVDNVVESLRLALLSDTAAGRTYFITNGESPRLWDVIRTVLSRVGIDPRLRKVSLRGARIGAAVAEMMSRLTGREPTLTRYTAAILGCTQTYNIAAARRDLGYAPLVSLEEGIGRTLEAWTADGVRHAG